MSKIKFKKICWSCLAFVCAGLTIVFLAGTACKTKTDMRELVDIPTMQEEYIETTHQPKNYIDKHTIGQHFSMQKSANWVQTEVPTDFNVIMLDSHYRQVDYYHFLKFNNWFKKLLFEAGIQAGIESKHQALDCDNFAMLYKSLMGISAYKSGDKLEMAVAVVVVRQVNEFGGIPGNGGFHMVNLVFTPGKWLIYEPQTGEYIKLEDYPNQAYVQYMIL
tara:strand:+ start:2940 stop:3596 length:657 start_codon:yes stop_codon:yes gene_type:complete